MGGCVCATAVKSHLKRFGGGQEFLRMWCSINERNESILSAVSTNSMMIGRFSNSRSILNVRRL